MISSIDPSTNIITVDANQSYGVTSGDVFILAGTLNAAPKGIPYHVNNAGDWLGVTRSTTPLLQSLVQDAGAVEVSRPILFSLLRNIERISGKDNINPKEQVFCSFYDQQQTYSELGYSTQRYEGKIGTFDPGIDALAFEGRPWVGIDDAPSKKIYMIQKDTFFLITSGGKSPNWVSVDGKTFRMVPNVSGDGRSGYANELEAYLDFFFNIGNDAPNRSGVETNLATVTGYSTFVV